MTKKLIAIPQGSLMRIAATKGVETVVALKEKTGVDRKTLRAINTGQPVKETTLQAIADKLRVPLAHLLGPSTLDEVENSSSLTPHRVPGDPNQPPFATTSGYQLREIKLQRLDAAALRRLAEESIQITWILKVDQMSESLEATLLKLREGLRGWYYHLLGVPIDEQDLAEQDNLVDQIACIKTSVDIDNSVEQLAKENLTIYGSTFVYWEKERPRDPIEDYPLPILIYVSRTSLVLSIAPEEKNNSTAHVSAGWEPPQEFDESELIGIECVKIDGRTVWSRHRDDPDMPALAQLDE